MSLIFFLSDIVGMWKAPFDVDFHHLPIESICTYWRWWVYLLIAEGLSMCRRSLSLDSMLNSNLALERHVCSNMLSVWSTCMEVNRKFRRYYSLASEELNIQGESCSSVPWGNMETIMSVLLSRRVWKSGRRLSSWEIHQTSCLYTHFVLLSPHLLHLSLLNWLDYLPPLFFSHSFLTNTLSFALFRNKNEEKETEAHQFFNTLGPP